MTDTFMQNLTAITPEVALALGTMVMMMVGAFWRGNGFKAVSVLSVVLWAGLGLYLVTSWSSVNDTQDFWNGALIRDNFARVIKLMMTAGTAAALIISYRDLKSTILGRFEYPVLMGFSLLGMYLMVSASDLILMYVGLELSSLALYVLAAFNRNSSLSSEAGLKYFILGAIASGLILFGSSLLYGLSGTTNFTGIATAVAGLLNTSGAGSVLDANAAFALVLVLAGITFKMAVVPFHIWTPDVYDGSPTSVTAFFAIVPQVAAIGMFVRFLSGPLLNVVPQFVSIITFIAVASMLVGAFAAITQKNLKRLLAYSSIGNIGYVMMAFAVWGPQALNAIILYSIIYMTTSVGIFSIILMLRKGGHAVEKISDLAGLSKTHPVMAYAMTAMMFSIAGIPPLAGFFTKLMVFQTVVSAGAYWLAIVGVLTSVVSAWYYINIIRVMFFEEKADEMVTLDRAPATMVVLGLVLAVLVFFILGADHLVANIGFANTVRYGASVTWN